MSLSPDVYYGTLDAQDTLRVESIGTSERRRAHKTWRTPRRLVWRTPICWTVIGPYCICNVIGQNLRV